MKQPPMTRETSGLAKHEEMTEDKCECRKAFEKEDE